MADVDYLQRQNRTGRAGIWACHEHLDRIKCNIPGCAKTASRERVGSEWFCAEHWKRHCPPRSMRRRAYRWYFRQAKRYGWDNALRTRFWRFWDALTQSAIARHEAGSIDVAEINRMMGWDVEHEG